jgi:FkbM family methyltransferase
MGMRKTVELRPGWFLVYHPSAFRFAYFAQQHDPDQVEEFDGFIAQCQPGMVLFDIGAHFGLFSLAALHYGGMTAKAVAVDPSPTACRIMRIQAELNGASRRLEIVQACVGSRVGWNDMVDSGIQSASYFVQPSQDHAGRELTRTRSITLDALSKQIEAYPTHVKIDVEGCEEEVLRGGTSTLSRTEGPLLFIELHNQIVSEQGGNPRRVLALLGELGYDTFASDGGRLDHSQILSKPLIRIMARKGSCSEQ